jgi:hypothetical protein
VTPKRPRTLKKIATPGHYTAPTVKLPGMSSFNMPGRGRVGKQLPQPRKPGKK